MAVKLTADSVACERRPSVVGPCVAAGIRRENRATLTGSSDRAAGADDRLTTPLSPPVPSTLLASGRMCVYDDVTHVGGHVTRLAGVSTHVHGKLVVRRLSADGAARTAAKQLPESVLELLLQIPAQCRPIG